MENPQFVNEWNLLENGIFQPAILDYQSLICSESAVLISMLLPPMFINKKILWPPHMIPQSSEQP